MKKILIYVTLVAALAFVLVGIHPSEAQVTTGSLTTMFASNNGQSGNMFDVTVLGTADVTITSFDINCDVGATNFEVYYKAGTYVGSETTPGAWTLAGSLAGVTCNGLDVPTPLAIGGIVIPAGQTYGLYVTDASGTGINYTNGANTFANADIQIDLGVGVAYPFGSTFSPRSWNGTIYYEYGTAVVPPVAVTVLNVPHVDDIRINAGSNVPAYDGPAGSQVKLLNGRDVFLPQDYDGNGYDTYVVTDTAVVDGVTWYSIFLGNEQFVWVNGSQVILQ